MKMFKKLLFGALIVGLGAQNLSAVRTRPPVERVVQLPGGRTVTIVDGKVVASTQLDLHVDVDDAPLVAAVLQEVVHDAHLARAAQQAHQNKACKVLVSLCAATALTLGTLNTNQSWTVN